MRLYNTLTHQNEELHPLNKREVSLYTCGLTVYSHPHIGNWVAYIYWDILKRTLQAAGHKVKHIQNITDVGHLVSDEDEGEDKLQKGADKEGVTAWDIAERYSKIADQEAYDQLKLLRPSAMPRATDYIDQQIQFVNDLEGKGYTYKIDDGVYFDTSKLSDYGKLAQLDVKGLQSGIRVADSGKKNPTDFALWKLSPKLKTRDMEWQSPWGKGFPGWHLECSVMARELLGDQIDIHTGGIDHIPVHHTNEIAQTEALTGKSFASIWLHANHIKVDGTKMSKSLGNIYTLENIQQRGYDIQAFKLLVISKHYRTEGNFSWEILDAAQNRLNHWRQVADLRWQLSDMQTENHNKLNLQKYLEDDLDTPAAVAAIDSLITRIEENTTDTPKSTLTDLIEEVDNLLGIDLTSSDITKEQKELIAKRQQARDNKDWEASDKLRAALKLQGIGLNDKDKKTHWYRIR